MTPDFFIFYPSRSGSTFLAKLLCDNSSIVIPPEANFLKLLIENKRKIQSNKDLISIIFKDSKFHDWGLSREFLKEHFSQFESFTHINSVASEIFKLYIEQYASNFDACFGIKKGSYAPYYKRLKELFPNCKFILLIRDGRAIFNSQKKSIYSVTQEPFENDPKKAAKNWNYYMNLFQRIRKEFPRSTLSVRYEDVVSDKEVVLNSILEFLKKKREEPAYQYFIPDRYGYGLHKNIDYDPLISSIDKWKNELTKIETDKLNALSYKYLVNEGYLKDYIGFLERLKIKFLY